MKLFKRLIPADPDPHTRCHAQAAVRASAFGAVANHINAELKRAAAWTPQLLMLPRFIVEARKLLRPWQLSEMDPVLSC